MYDSRSFPTYYRQAVKYVGFDDHLRKEVYSLIITPPLTFARDLVISTATLQASWRYNTDSGSCLEVLVRMAAGGSQEKRARVVLNEAMNFVDFINKVEQAASGL